MSPAKIRSPRISRKSSRPWRSDQRKSSARILRTGIAFDPVELEPAIGLVAMTRSLIRECRPARDAGRPRSCGYIRTLDAFASVVRHGPVMLGAGHARFVRVQ